MDDYKQKHLALISPENLSKFKQDVFNYVTYASITSKKGLVCLGVTLTGNYVVEYDNKIKEFTSSYDAILYYKSIIK